MKTCVVDVSSADPATLSAIWNAAVAPGSAIYRHIDADEFAERMAGRAGVPSDLLVTAEDSGGVTGFALGCTRGVVEETQANLAALAVLPEHRGKGVGKRLLMAFETRAAAAGCKAVQIAPASHVRFAWGVDPRSFGYAWLWRQGYSVYETQVYMSLDCRGWTRPAALVRSLEHLRGDGIEVRPATGADTPSLVKCAGEIQDRIAVTLGANAAAEHPCPVLVAVRGSDVVGFVGRLTVSPCGIPDFDLIAVSESARGHGVATALFGLALEHFARQGARLMELMTAPTNPAQKIYIKAGFSNRACFACFLKRIETA